VDTTAVVLEAPERLVLSRLDLSPPVAGDVVVDVDWSGISTGTERLLWSGRMPPFPGMGYPLVPGYESVGRVVEADASEPPACRRTRLRARCALLRRGPRPVRWRRVPLVVPGRCAPSRSMTPGRAGVLLALAATAQHAIAAELPELIVGHGVLGRLIARIVVAAGGTPTVWETDPKRAPAAPRATRCWQPERTPADYRAIIDASGDAAAIWTARHAARARRRDRARRLLCRTPLSFAFPAGLHARGALPYRRRMAGTRISPPSGI
jgi:3-hydroxyethyl bacteriochlorophyllide a dehydrogenase